MANLEEHSQRIGVAVTLTARLYQDGANEDTRLRPTAGPAAREPGEPTLRVTGQEGEDDYRRTWTVEPPETGASALVDDNGTSVVRAGVGGPMLGFEDEGGIVDLSLEPVDDGGASTPRLLGEDGDEHVVMAAILPRKVRIRFNAHRVADEAEVELPLAAFPFPPDGSIVRSLMIEIRTGLISADDWAAHLQRGELAADGRPLTMPALSSLTDEPAFVGFVDKHRVRVSSDDAATVTLPARDFAGVLADEPCRGRKLETDLPVDECIARFLSTFASCVGLSVVWLGPDSPPTLGGMGPKAKRAANTVAAKRKKGTGGHAKGSAAPKKIHADKSRALDALTEYCTLAAVIPTFRGWTLYLAGVRTLDQFTASDVPALVFGEDVESFELEHSLTANKAAGVEVRSFNSDTGRVVAGRYPAELFNGSALQPGDLAKATNGGPLWQPPGAGGIDEAAAHVMIVQAITDVVQLTRIARNVYEEGARQELTGKIQTKAIATSSGRARGAADLLDLRAGSAIGLRIAPTAEAAMGSYVQRLATMPQGEAIDLLISQGWAPKLARRIVGGILSAGRPLVYRVKEVQWSWALDAATSWEIDVLNYIESRDAPEQARKGGRFHAALDRGDSYVSQWAAIDADMMDGEFSPATAEALKREVGAAERRRRMVDGDSDAGGSSPL